MIPTFNRPLLLYRCLASLSVQDIPQDQFEVIVVDDDPKKSAQETVEYFQNICLFPIRYCHTSGSRGPATARNTGIRLAISTIIAFTDDDCIPDPSWVRNGMEVFKNNPKAAGISGKIIVPYTNVPTDYELNTARLAASEFVTANCFYRKYALLEVGGFDERFRTSWREDADLQFTLLERGFLLVTSDAPQVIHPVRKAHWGISVREQKKSMYNALLHKKHPALYRRKIQKLLPVHYYFTVCTFGGMILSAILGFTLYRNIFFTLWIISTVFFAYKRLNKTNKSFFHLTEMAVTSIVIPFLSVFWRLYGALKFNTLFI